MKFFLINISAILFGSLIFAASFPNSLFNYGLPFLAWAAYVPVFWVIRRIEAPLPKAGSRTRAIFAALAIAALYGALYGYTSYRLFAPWLGAFHPLGGTIVSLFKLVYMAVLFPLLKLALIFYPKKGYILQWLIWLSYEYLGTLGFLGFPYGITGYTQWQFPLLTGISSVFGVWGVSALVLFPSVYLGNLTGFSGESSNGFSKNCFAFFRAERLAAAAWLGALVSALIFGQSTANSISNRNSDDFAGTVKIALIQQNSDPWKEGITGARRDLATLAALSEKALAEEPNTDLVVWPETAFVPRIYWHNQYRDNAEYYALVKELLDFLDTQKVPFLIGNDDARLEVTKSGWDRVDYNAALLFEGSEIRQIYRKNHLVPFAEYFPYEKTFPRLHNALAKANTHFWKPGSEKTVFTAGKLRFSAPICFEDCFGYISRDFVRNGAHFIVNLTNDAWAGSRPGQIQHLSMSVFRAAENRRSLVRAATSGETCAIDPSGKITAIAPPFTETYLCAEIPLYTGTTPYSFWGDLWAQLFIVCASILLLIGAVRSIIRGIITGRKL